MGHTVTVFSPYAFKAGQKIRIDSGRRKGDWEVVSTTDNKITLRCPISHKEFTWDKFCYLISEETDGQWPLPES